MDENLQRTPASVDVCERRMRNGAALTVLELLAVLGIIALLVCFLLPAVQSRGPSRRISCKNNLKQIALALRNYESFHHAMPPAYTTDADGKPLHSWRTLILPFMEQNPLYETIDLTKPWDDPANAEACKTVLDVFQCPSVLQDDNRTTYLAIVTPNSCFRAAEPTSLSDITDGVSNTMMVIEVDSAHAVPWMSPVDADESVVLGLGPESKLPHNQVVQAAFVDSHVGHIEADMTAAQRRAMISIAGNDNAAPEDAE